MVCGVMIVAGIFVGAGWLLTRRGLAGRSGTLHLPGLSAPVIVIRDQAGIPHIHAQNRRDLARALGYVQAQDRLFEIELGIRLGQGRLAEIVGPELVESDRVFRTFDAEGFARATLAMYPPEVRAEVEAFAYGINAWIDQLGDRPPLPFWLLGIRPRRISAVDMIASMLPVSLLLSTNLNSEVLYLNLAPRLQPDVVAELMPVALGLALEPPPTATTEFIHATRSAGLWPLTVPRALRTGIAASNNWVIDGTKSVSGKPMLANDPHLPQSLPSIWYEAVLSTPDTFTAGAMVTGSQSMAIGTNGHVAWGVTNVQADVMDLCIEQLSPDGKSYLFRGEWLPVEERAVTIGVKGRPDETYVIRSTRHGPLIDDLLMAPGALLSTVPLHHRYALALRLAAPPGAMAWTGIEAARARTGAELVEAYRHFTGAVLNLVWADKAGNIGWHVVGAVPDRDGFTGKYPMPCASGEFEWRGMIPYDRLPHIENPPAHFIVTANDRVTDVPYNGDWMPPWRRDRIAQLLAARDRLSVEDFKTIQRDRVSLYARSVRDLVLRAGDGGDGHLAWALSELRAWDGAMNGTSRAAALCAAVQVTLPARVLKPLVGDDYRRLLAVADFGTYNASEDIVARPYSQLWPSKTEERWQLIRGALKDALSLLTERLGRNPSRWSWERLHTVTFKNQIGAGSGLLSRILGSYFNRGPYPDAGGRHTVNNSWFDLKDPFAATQISSYRFIVDMAHPEQALAMNHTGESDIPASPHYGDMIGRWRRHEYHPLTAGDKGTGTGTECALMLVP
jgi:penicillin amidase